MEYEKMISGYCRRIDQSRIVTLELEDGKLQYVDCLYESCVYRPNCPIAREIERLQDTQ